MASLSKQPDEEVQECVIPQFVASIRKSHPEWFLEPTPPSATSPDEPDEPLTADEILGPLYVALATLERRAIKIKVLEMDLREEKAKSERLAGDILTEQAMTKSWIRKCGDFRANATSLAGATTELIDERDASRAECRRLHAKLIYVAKSGGEMHRACMGTGYDISRFLLTRPDAISFEIADYVEQAEDLADCDAPECFGGYEIPS